MPWHYRLYAGGSGLARSLHGFINYAYMGNPYTDLHSFFSDERGPYCAPSMDANASNNSRLQSAALAFVLRPSKIANANNKAAPAEYNASLPALLFFGFRGGFLLSQP